MQHNTPLFRTGIGQSSHRFLPEDSSKPCMLGGVIFDDVPGLDAESDGDVVYHAICNAISSLSGTPILERIAKDLCRKDGITDSQVYTEKALPTLGVQKIVHVAISLEAKKPSFDGKIDLMRKKISKTLRIQMNQVGITAISSDGLTDFGCGDGVQCFAIITTMQPAP